VIARATTLACLAGHPTPATAGYVSALRNAYGETELVQASAIAAMRAGLYQAGVKPWAIAPWAHMRAVTDWLVDPRNATLQRTGCTSAHRTSRVGSTSGVIDGPFLGHLTAFPAVLTVIPDCQLLKR
jgi:hypothetical protein